MKKKLFYMFLWLFGNNIAAEDQLFFHHSDQEYEALQEAYNLVSHRYNQLAQRFVNLEREYSMLLEKFEETNNELTFLQGDYDRCLASILHTVSSDED